MGKRNQIMDQIREVLQKDEQRTCAEEVVSAKIQVFPRSKYWDLGLFTTVHCSLEKLVFNEGLLSGVRNWWSVYYQPKGHGFHVMFPSSFYPDDGTSDRLIASKINMYLVGIDSEHLLEGGYFVDFYHCFKYYFINYVEDEIWTEDIQQLRLEITLKRISPAEPYQRITEENEPISRLTRNETFDDVPPATINVGKYFLSPQFSDIWVRCEDIRFPLHRIVVHEKCPAFAELFKSTDGDLECGFGDCGRQPNSGTEVELLGVEGIVFFEFLRFMYEGIANNMYEVGISLYELAHKYKYDELKKYCESVLLQLVDSENMLNMYVFGKKYDLAKLTYRANQVFLDSTTCIYQPEYLASKSQSELESEDAESLYEVNGVTVTGSETDLQMHEDYYSDDTPIQSASYMVSRSRSGSENEENYDSDRYYPI